MAPQSLTGLPVLPSDQLMLDHVALWDVYRQLGINYGDRIFARIMDADNEDTPLENITWRKLLTDATKLAGALKEKIGSDSEENITYGLLANSSYAYYVNIVAGLLNHWIVILLSTRNSVAGNDSLLRAVKAKVLITDNKNIKAAEAILQELPIKLLDLQRPDEIHTNVKLPAGPIRVSTVSREMYEQAAMYLHTSGTSGHPKPIPHSHEQITKDIVAVRNNVTFPGAPCYIPLPLFHGIGIYSFTRWPIGAGHIPTFINTRLPTTSTTLLQHLKRLPGALCFLAPMLLEELLREPPEAREILKTTCRVFYGGGPLDKQAGQQLVKMGVPLVGAYGATEISMITVPDFPGPPENRVDDLPYMRFFDQQYNIHWEPFDGKISELIVCPGKLSVPAVFNHQNPAGYATNDLWEPHPTIPGLYKHCGRKDSVTVLSNGEKTDNRQIEFLLIDDPLVSGVIVFGAGRPLNGVLIGPEPSAQNLSSKDFIDAVWPTIEHVNTIVPNHSRIIRQMVVVADVQKKPFIRSDKGSIKTKDTLGSYKKEIDAAYGALGTEAGEEVVKNINTPEEIMDYVKQVILRAAKMPFNDDDDFFENGLDSLHAVQIRTEVKPLFTKFVKGEEILHNITYTYPTISRLSAYLIARSKGENVGLDDPTAMASRLEAYTERWSAKLPKRATKPLTAEPKKTFALTGSTGSLGVHTLRYLLERDDVEKVYCLHRGSSDDAAQKHRKLFQDRALPVELMDSEKLAFAQVDLSKPDLALPVEKYEELCSSLTHIIHAAWELNFNWGVERFEKIHIAGVRHLVDLAIASTLPRPPRVVFISSIGVVSKHSADIPVPEEPLDNPDFTGPSGYGESKFVSERVLDMAAEISRVPVTIIRSGQIAGSSLDGYWAPTEYIPTIFRSSKILGKVPNKLPNTRWLPADYCGKAVLELALQNEDYLQYYHLENPTSTPWSTIASLFIEACRSNVEAVDTEDWLAAVEQANRVGVDIPAAALLQFYSEYSSSDWQVQLETTKAGRVSQAIAYGPITPELMSKYTSWI